MAAGSGKPALQSFGGLFSPVEMAESVRVDDAARGRIEPDGELVDNVEWHPSDLEGVLVKAVPGDGGSGAGHPSRPRQRNIDGRRNVVGEVVVSQRRGQADCRVRGPDGDLDEVQIRLQIRPGVDPSSNALDVAVVACGVKRSVRPTSAACIGVSEDRCEAWRQECCGDR